MADTAPTPDKKSSVLKKALIWLAGLTLFGLLAAALALWAGHAWLQNAFAAPGPSVEETIIDLPRGEGLIRIGQRLESEGLISDHRVFRIAITLDGGQGDLRAGEYAIPAGASMAEIYEILTSGVTVQHPITFPEGLTSAMIVAVLNEAEVLRGEIGAIPEEGSLLPETYLVDRGTERQGLVDRMERAQIELIEELWPQRQEGLPISSPEEAVILASIVEKETALAEERPLVAAVFINRLNQNMRLEADSTVEYGVDEGRPLGRGLRRSELDDPDNPWNTYQHRGLPPTPIANPGRESIAAVLNPAESRALFFVADGTGGHAFSETYAEHQRNVAVWRRIERQRRQAANQ